MTTSLVYPQGTAQVTVAAAGSIAVASYADCTVQRAFGFPNYPPSISDLGVVNAASGMTVFGPYASGATILIQAGASPAFYETGTDPVVKSEFNAVPQGAPTALNTTGALTADAIFSGIVTSTTAAAVTATLPTGEVMDDSAQFAVGDSFDFYVINTGGTNAIPVTPAASGHTVVGAGAVAANTSGHFRTRKTAADTFVCYRIS